jgi:hypothetical protein
MAPDPRTTYPDLYEQYPELYHEYPEVASAIYHRLDEHDEEWVLEHWEQEFLPATPITTVPDKDELPFFDPDQHDAWTDEEKAKMGRAYSAYRENLRKASFASEEAVRERLADGYVFRLTSSEDSDTQSWLVTHQGFDRPAAKPLDGPPAFRFAPLADDQPITVRLPDIQALEPVSIAALNPSRQESVVTALISDLSSNPDTISLATIEETLQCALDGDVDPTRAGHVARTTIQTRDDEETLEALAEPLFALLEHADPPVGPLLCQALRTYTETNPATVEPYVPELRSLLTEAASPAGPASCLATLAGDRPNAVLDAVPALATVATGDDQEARKWAVYAFSKVASSHPEALFPALDVLVDASTAGDENLRTNALSALGKVTGLYPDAALTVLEDLVELLDSDHPSVRGNAVGLLGDIAQEHPDRVINYAPAIARCLTDESEDVRQNAALTLIRAGGADPAAVKAEHELLEAALDDSDPDVRANACTLVGNAHAPVSTDRLQELRDDDPDARVQEQAAWALNRLP